MGVIDAVGRLDASCKVGENVGFEVGMMLQILCHTKPSACHFIQQPINRHEHQQSIRV
jgi:hypothetical protein